MTPEAFAAKSTEALGGRYGSYRHAAGPADLGNGHQAVVYRGTNDETGKAEYVLYAADTDPASNAFGEQAFPPTAVDVLDEESALRFEGVAIPTFQGLGDLTVPYPQE